MAPPKRKVGGSNSVRHEGRVTRHADAKLPYAEPPSVGASTRQSGNPPPASRYTPPAVKLRRVRPDWHRWIGVALIIVGLFVIVGNDAMLFMDTTLLPGGHSEAYLFLGIAIAVTSSRFFGWFDRAR